MSDQPEPLGCLTDAIKDLAARNDLAAVILHLNDTYQIEARPPDIPGMARVATAVECVRNLVRTLTGEDRTLVVHAGDFLSPSHMTTRLGVAGKQVVELSNCCGVDYATIGNHEFDVTPDQLKERLDEASFPILCANLTAPPTLPQLVTIEYCPRERPFLALSGLAGRQTIKKAIGPRFGFQETGWEDALKRVLEEVQARQEIGAFVLLTHMDRDEDKDTQSMLGLYWAKNGAAFVLGGHDHDISWQEPGANSILCKNLSNCRTLTPWCCRSRRSRCRRSFRHTAIGTYKIRSSTLPASSRGTADLCLREPPRTRRLSTARSLHGEGQRPWDFVPTSRMRLPNV